MSAFYFQDPVNKSKRLLLSQGVRLVLSIAFTSLPLAHAFAAKRTHRLKMYCPDTNENFNEIMIVDGHWVDGSIIEFSKFARDWHADRFLPFDPKIILCAMQIQFLMNCSQPLHLLSGYRTPHTNSRTPGSSKNSFHMKARAFDLYQPSRSVIQLNKAAISLSSGGVGYYPRKNFVHIDSGKTRRWTK